MGPMLGATREEPGVRGALSSAPPGRGGRARAGAGDGGAHHRQGLSRQTRLWGRRGAAAGTSPAWGSAQTPRAAGAPHHHHLHPADTPLPAPRCRCRLARHRSASGAAPGLCPQPDTEQNKSKFPGS